MENDGYEVIRRDASEIHEDSLLRIKWGDENDESTEPTEPTDLDKFKKCLDDLDIRYQETVEIGSTIISLRAAHEEHLPVKFSPFFEFNNSGQLVSHP